MITKELFGNHEGKDVFLYKLDNENGLSVEIITFGGVIKNIYYKGLDLVLGRDSLEEYLDNDGYLGALIGRNSNRIQNAEFELGGKVYKLFPNDKGVSNLHGGKIGYDSRVWDSEAVDGKEPALILTLHSPDGEEGFPGNADIKVTYTVTTENSLKIHYEAVCDADTVMNMTNHAYFNLNGHNSGVTDNHTLTLDSDFYTPNTEKCLPYGEILSVEGTVFDLRKPVRLGDVFESDNEQIKMFKGFDHNFCLNGRGFRKVSELCGDKSGIKMETYTDLPGIQVYCGNFLKPERVCKGGAIYDSHHAICLETQVFPNAMALPHFPSPILRKGEKYDTVTEYKFI